MKIISIAAIGKNRVIGKNNQLLWHLPNDFKFFKEQTSGHYILMGRKTLESFPKPLPNRVHLVITSQKNYTVEHEQVLVFHSIEEAVLYAKKQNQEKLFVIGGAMIYEQTLNIADELWLTEVDYDGEGDAFFPEFAFENYTKEFVKAQELDEKHKYQYQINKYIKN